MTAAQFTKLRQAAGFKSQQAAAKFLHRSLRAVHGWENGKPIDPLAIALFRLMVRLEVKAEDMK